MKKIHFYHSKKFLEILIAVLISVIILTMIIDLIELLRRLSNKDAGFFIILKLALLKQPSLIAEIFPFIILLTSIIFFHKLSNDMVITVLNAAGMSLRAIFIAPIMIIVLIYIMELTIFNQMVKKFDKQYKINLANILQSDKRYDEKQQGKYNKELWLLQKNQDYSYIINAMKVMIHKEQVLFKDVKIFFIQNYQLPIYLVKKYNLQNLENNKVNINILFLNHI